MIKQTYELACDAPSAWLRARDADGNIEPYVAHHGEDGPLICTWTSTIKASTQREAVLDAQRQGWLVCNDGTTYCYKHKAQAIEQQAKQLV